METLPEDAVAEILVHVGVGGVPAVFRCAATCKRWRRLIADASFLFRLWPEGVPHPSFLLGFLATPPPRRRRIISGPVPSFALTPWSPLGDRYRFPRYSIRGLPKDGRFHMVPLTSRGGLLLNHIVQLVYPDNNLTEDNYLSLAVCDPLAGVGRVLPPLKYNGEFTMVGYTILTDLDCCSDKRRWPVYSDSESFKVLIISVDKGQPGYNLHVFTPAEWSWSTPTKFFGALEHGVHVEPQQASAVVCRGTAHWLFRETSSFYTLNVCAKTAQTSLTRLPITPSRLDLNLYSEPMLSVTIDGTLSLLRLYRKFTMLEIWTCQGDNESEDGTVNRWYHTKMIKLKQSTRSKINDVQCVCVGEMSGKLLVNDNQGCVHIVDLQTGAMEMVTEWFRGPVESAILFEMDWPAFFMSRLADNGIKRTKLGGAIQKIADSFWGLVVVSVIVGPIAMRWVWT